MVLSFIKLVKCVQEIFKIIIQELLLCDTLRRNVRYIKRNSRPKIFLIVVVILMFSLFGQDYTNYPNLEKREAVIKLMERKLQEALKEDKGTGCNIPKLDPFAEEITQLEMPIPKIECGGFDWVSCYMSECKVKEDTFITITNITCTYKDIFYSGDWGTTNYSPEVKLNGNETYLLERSDNINVRCIGKNKEKGDDAYWSGILLGFRSTVKPEKPPPGRDLSPNVVILCFDSTSHSGFIRRMPKSYKVLTTELNATVLNGYNIVGDATPAAMLPLLTGRNEFQYPNLKRGQTPLYVDFMPFLFYNFQNDGYRTAYFEDAPMISTFNYRFNGFKKQPTDHYLRSFLIEEAKEGMPWKSSAQKYCIGDTLLFKLMLNITNQFLHLDGKKFCLTFINDVTHDNFSLITMADDDTAEFLRNLKDSGRLEDTMIIVMGDHGSRFSRARNTITGKLEERLPLMAITLPYSLKRQNTEAQKALEHNRDVLTTPYDIHTTILDVVGLRQYKNNYKIPGADLTRGLTLLEPIPKTRSCSEASIEAHWCACLSWRNVTNYEYLYYKVAKAFLDHINSLTKPLRDQCVERTLTSIEWVMRQEHNKIFLNFSVSQNNDGNVTSHTPNTEPSKENYQAKIIIGPGDGILEASMMYNRDDNKVDIDTRDISRINAYGDEPSCISRTHPHLNMFCFCKHLLNDIF